MHDKNETTRYTCTASYKLTLKLLM